MNKRMACKNRSSFRRNQHRNFKSMTFILLTLMLSSLLMSQSNELKVFVKDKELPHTMPSLLKGTVGYPLQYFSAYPASPKKGLVQHKTPDELVFLGDHGESETFVSGDDFKSFWMTILFPPMKEKNSHEFGGRAIDDDIFLFDDTKF